MAVRMQAKFLTTPRLSRGCGANSGHNHCRGPDGVVFPYVQGEEKSKREVSLRLLK